MKRPVYGWPNCERFVDAKLSDVGHVQCQEANAQLRNRQVPFEVDLVLVSPFTRTLETAAEVLKDTGAPQPYLVLPMIREIVDNATCNEYRPLSEIREFVANTYPKIQFDFDTFDVPDVDPFAGPKSTDEAESPLDCTRRGIEFLDWVGHRPEKRIAVVTHSMFLLNLFHYFKLDQPVEERDFFASKLNNTEIRPLLLQASEGTETEFTMRSYNDVENLAGRFGVVHKRVISN